MPTEPEPDQQPETETDPNPKETIDTVKQNKKRNKRPLRARVPVKSYLFPPSVSPRARVYAHNALHRILFLSPFFFQGVDGAPVVHELSRVPTLLHDTAGRWKRGQERGGVGTRESPRYVSSLEPRGWDKARFRKAKKKSEHTRRHSKCINRPPRFEFGPFGQKSRFGFFFFHS